MCTEIITADEKACSTCGELAAAVGMTIRELPVSEHYVEHTLKEDECLCPIDTDRLAAMLHCRVENEDGLFVVFRALPIKTPKKAKRRDRRNT